MPPVPPCSVAQWLFFWNLGGFLFSDLGGFRQEMVIYRRHSTDYLALPGILTDVHCRAVCWSCTLSSVGFVKPGDRLTVYLPDFTVLSISAEEY